MNLLSLPREVISHIAEFLDVKDLLACSATCSSFRNILNDNFIWKKRYRAEIVEYIKSAKSYIKPEFEYHKGSDSLDVVCDERINLMRQNHLLNNWRQDRYISYETRAPGSASVLDNNDRQIIYNNDYIFLHVLNSNEIHVWDVTEVPYLYTSVQFSLYECNLEDEDWPDITKVWYQIVNNMLLVVQGNLVQIFRINLPEKLLPLEFLISIDNEAVVKDFAETYYTNCYNWIVGHRLFSRLCYQPEVHIWDILTGAKLKTLRSPTEGWDMYIISTDDQDNVICTLRTDDPFMDGPEDYSKISNHVSRYSVSKDEFMTLFSNLPGCKPVYALQHKDTVFLFCIDDMFLFRCSIHVFDYTSMAVKARKTFMDLVGLYKSKIIDGCLILATQTSVDIIDVTNLENLKSIKISDIFEIDFLPVFSMSVIITPSLNDNSELWDIDKNQLLMKIPQENYVFVNDSCSKLIMLSGQRMTVKHYW